MKRRILIGAAVVLASAQASFAQNAVTLVSASGYGNLETGGVLAVISGDANRNAMANLAFRRAGDPTFALALPLMRVDMTRFAGSLFGLTPGTSWEARVTITDPD